MAKQLVVNLVGRICLVTKGENLWAVFLNARHNPKLGLPEHTPLLSVPMSMVASQKMADDAHVTGSTFVKRTSDTVPLMDSMGMWLLSGYDITIHGVQKGIGVRQIDDVSDLNAIVATVDAARIARFEPRILDKNPQRLGVVLARLMLPRSADVTAVTEDPVPRTFRPGGHTQKIATYVNVRIPFENDLKAPTLRLRTFNGRRRVTYPLASEGFSEVTLTMSNLCNCVAELTKKDASGAQIDDPEFGLYYELMRKPLPAQLPLPEVRFTLAGARVPECYDVARVKI